MKKNTLLTLVLGLVSAHSSFACLHTREHFLCTGDNVIMTDGTDDTVEAINPNDGLLSLSHPADLGPNSIVSGVSEATLYLEEGCLFRNCVGDSVIITENYDKHSGVRAEIAGVNPYNETYAVTYRGSWDYNVKTGLSDVNVYVEDGCTKGFCVGDTVLLADGTYAMVAGIDHIDHTVAASYRGDDGFEITTNLDPATLSLTDYCEKYGPGHPFRASEDSFPRSGWAFRDGRE